MDEVEMRDLHDGRSEVPLRMITKNIDILLEHSLPCESISFRRDSHSENALILVIHGANHDVAAELGFELRSMGE